MQVISYINVDLIEPSSPPRVYAKQYDEDGRWIYATITQNGAEYDIPSGAYAVFAAAKPDGTYAIYDSNEQNDVAVFISGSVVQVQLTSAVLNVAGTTLAQISLYSANAEKITTFTFVIEVSASVVDGDSVPEDYINVLTGLIQQAVAAQNAAADSAAAAQEAASSITTPIPITAGGTGGTAVIEALHNLGILAGGINRLPTSTVTQYRYVQDFAWYTGTSMTTAEFMSAMPTDTTVIAICSLNENSAKPIADCPSTYTMMMLVKGSNNNYRNGIAWNVNAATPKFWVYSSNGSGTANWAKIMTSADFTLTNGVLHINTL